MISALFSLLFITTTTTPTNVGVGGIGITVHLLSCHPVSVSDHVCTISPEPHNHFLPNLLWWCIIMRQCVFEKNWFTVKVTVRAYIIKI